MAKVNYLMQQTPFKVEFLKSNAILKQDNWKNMSMNILRREFICILHLFFFFSFFFSFIFIYRFSCCLVTKLCPTLLQPHELQPTWLLSKGFPKQEYQSGQPFPFLEDLPDSGIKPASLVLDSLPHQIIDWNKIFRLSDTFSFFISL